MGAPGAAAPGRTRPGLRVADLDGIALVSPPWRRLTGRTRVWLLNIALAGAAVIFYFGLVEPVPRLPGQIQVAWPLLAVGFYLADVLVVHFHFHRDAHSFSLSDVPLVLGLFFASPGGLVLAQGLGVGAALAINRRQSPIKLVFNVSKLCLEAALANFLFRHLLHGPALGPSAWLAAFVATAITAAAGAILIQAVISLSEGRLHFQNLSTMLVLALVGSLTGTSMALVGVTSLQSYPPAAWLLLIPIGTLFLAYRAYISERQKHESIEFLFESSRMLQRSREVEPAMVALLTHVRKMFRAESAEIMLYRGSEEEEALLTAVGPAALVEVMRPVTLSRDEVALSRLASLGQAVLLRRGAGAAVADRFLAAREVRDAMVASLRSEGRTFGWLAVCNRLGDVTKFDGEDLRLFETLAAQASISLENGRLEQSLAQLRKLEEELKHQAFHDSLTRLANRVLFAERVEHALSRRPGGGTSVAVLFLDLDDFKTVNDSLGHAAGDQLLVAIARRLERCIRPQDTAARLGGDEFAILLEEVAGLEEAAAVANRVLDALAPALEVAGREVQIHASIGIVLTTPGGDADELLRNADVAMYNAKREGKGGYEVFDPRMQAAVLGRHELKADMQRALRRREFAVHYQPMVDLVTGRIVALEALVRWHKPRRGMIGPDQFIPLAEETGLILPLGAYVLREACQRARQWQRAYPEHAGMAISVNISVKQLQSPELVDEVVGALAESGLDPANLILEITESAMMDDPEQMLARLRQLKEIGLRLAIDDFGTGYSSLTWLRHFPIDILKIAKPFVDNLGDGVDEGAVADAIAKLGGSLRMVVVAEGVEQLRQVEHLNGLNLGLGQGFYWARPVSAEDIERVLAAPAGEREWAAPELRV